MSDEIADIALDARQRLLRAELVADHWRKAAIDWGDSPLPGRVMAHPLCCVLEALRGESDLGQLGVDPSSEEGVLLARLAG